MCDKNPTPTKSQNSIHLMSIQRCYKNSWFKPKFCLELRKNREQNITGMFKQEVLQCAWSGKSLGNGIINGVPHGMCFESKCKQFEE